MPHDAAILARMLAQRIADLVTHLLPAGRREGHEWVHPSLTGGSRRSLSVHLTGAKAGVWADFAGGIGGDALDLVAHVQCHGRTADAMAWARRWLGMPSLSGSQSNTTATAPHPAPAERVGGDQEERRRKALGLFLAAREGVAGTPVAAYLAGRGIDLAQLGRAPRALRYHPAVWCEEARAKLPAMLAAITAGDGQHVATHRTWLRQIGGNGWAKAAVANPKKTLGTYAGGFIPLQRGASGKPMRAAPLGDVVAIAEGIETALSVAIACPDLRIIAAVSLANMARITLPEVITSVVLCADNDRPENLAAERALVAAVGHFAAPGRTVRLARPPVGKDFNDALQATEWRE